jgi:hypothetical protein
MDLGICWEVTEWEAEKVPPFRHSPFSTNKKAGFRLTFLFKKMGQCPNTTILMIVDLINENGYLNRLYQKLEAIKMELDNI